MAIDTVKICGLSTPEAVREAVKSGASHLGFIFFAKSPRIVTPAAAAALVAEAGNSKTVAVTVDADDAFLDDIDSTMEPDIHQLHGAETPDRVRAIQARFGKPVMKALAIRSQADLEKVALYDGVADLLLLDAKPPAGSQLPGGNGVTFDWALVAQMKTRTPILLSGGLGRINLPEAIEHVTDAANGLIGLDVSSGVESAPGVKDITKIRDFMALAHA
ncbi:MAG: phosphoribosylanthranilate isomerase [Pseudomonadota bacterium]